MKMSGKLLFTFCLFRFCKSLICDSSIIYLYCVIFTGLNFKMS